MPAPLEQLQTAGFSESEIGDWAKEQRTTLSSAGFGQDEIDDYLQGPPPRLEGLLRRVHRAIDPVAVATQFGEDFARGFKQGGGNLTGPLFSPEMESGLREFGLFGEPGKIGPAKFLTEPVIGTVATALRLAQAATYGLKEAVPVIGGPLAATMEAFPAGHFTGLPTPVNPLRRIEHGPTGEARSVPIGDLPQSTDFTDAARIVAQGDVEGAATAREKIETLWNEHGIHPAEVAHDIAGDPTILQDLLADDPKLPSAYVRDSEQAAAPRATEAAIPAGTLTPAVRIEGKLYTGATHADAYDAALRDHGGVDPGSSAADRNLFVRSDGRALTFQEAQAYRGRPAEAAAASPQIGSFTPDQLRLDPARFQFKEGTDESGLSQRLQGIEEWDPIKAGLGIVWEDAEGSPWIVDGHQRLGLARRIREADPGQDPRLNAWVLREADGISDADARAMAASKNIAEGTGSPVDAAKVLRDRPDLLPSLPPRSELVRQAQGLMKLDGQGFGKVVNGVVPANYAAIAGRLVPEGPDMAGMQNAILDLLAKTKPENATQTESIVRQGLDSGTHKELQQSLFGEEETVSSLYGLRAQLLDRAFKQLRRDRFVFSTLVDNQSIIEELGNQLAQDENLRRAATDGQAVQILQTLANRRGPLGDALTGAARSVAENGASPAAAARDFVAELRRQAASGDLARIADGGTRSPVAAAGESHEPAAPRGAEPERNPRDVAPAEEARAAAQVEQTIKPQPTKAPREYPAVDDPMAMMRRGELTAAPAEEIAKQLQDHFDTVENEIFGADAERLRRLHRQSNAAWNRADDARARQLDSEIAEIEAKATPEDMAHLEGRGAPEHVDAEGWRELARDLRDVEADREGAVNTIARRFRDLPNDGVPKTLSEREAIAVIGRAMQAEADRGGNIARLLDDAADERFKRYGGGDDAHELVDDQIRRLRALMEQPPPERLTLPAPKVEQTDQGAQLVIPGAERSAQQAMEAREAEGHGRIAPKTAQQEPGGLFEPPSPGQPGFEWGPETGAIANPFAKVEPPRTAAEQAILSRIDVGGAGDKRSWSWSRLYTQIVDKLHPIEEAVNAAKSEELPTAQNPYHLARLLAGNAGRARHWLEFGQVDFETGETIGPSLKQILAPVSADLDGFRAFAGAVRALELEHRGIETGFDMSAARQVAADGLEQYARILAETVRWQDSLARYLRDAGVLSPEGYTAMREANRLYVPFHRVIGDEPGSARGTGGSMQPQNPIQRIKGSERAVVDPIESMIRNAYLYVTMAERNVAGTTLVDLLRDAGDAHGRIRDVSTEHPRDTGAPPREGFPEPGAVAMPAGLDPEFATAIKEALDAHGLSDELFDFLASAAPPSEGEIAIFRNGKREVWQVGDDVARAVKALDQDSANMLVRLLAMPARLLRAGATLSPDFLLRNPVRDFFSAFVQTSTGIFHPIRSARGLYSAVIKDEAFQEWFKNGGGNAELVALDRRYLQDSLRDLTQQAGLQTRAWNVVRHPIDTLRYLSEVSEQATRLGEFKAVRARELAAGAEPKEAAQAAAFSSREVTVDFSRIGAATRSMNMITAFWNAQVQGVDRLARAIRDDPVRTGMRIAAGITVPSVILWGLNHDDPDYKELPDWQKDLFWVVPVGTAAPSPLQIAQAAERGEAPKNSAKFFLRIPKPFELGVLFGSGVERLLDGFVAHNPDAAANFAKSVSSALLPSFMPTFGLPALEQYANMSSLTDRKLIPAQMEKLLPEYQYQPYTTETAKALGRLVSAFPGVRDTAVGDGPMSGSARALSTPILLENYLRGWTGGLGTYMLQIADAGLRKSGVLPDPPKPADTLADIPIVKAFVVRHPSGSAESLALFYEEHDKNKRYFDSWMAKAKEGDLPALEAIQNAGGPRIFVQFDAMHQALGEHSKLIRDIWKSPEIAPDEKRQLIDQLYYSEIQIAKAGRDAMRAVDQGIAAEAAMRR